MKLERCALGRSRVGLWSNLTFIRRTHSSSTMAISAYGSGWENEPALKRERRPCGTLKASSKRKVKEYHRWVCGLSRPGKCWRLGTKHVTSRCTSLAAKKKLRILFLYIFRLWNFYTRDQGDRWRRASRVQKSLSKLERQGCHHKVDVYQKGFSDDSADKIWCTNPSWKSENGKCMSMY